MIRAYIFDLDGTLVDSEVIWVEAIHAYLHEHAHSFSEADARGLVYGRSWFDIYGDIVRMYPELDMPIRDMEAVIAPHYKRLADRRDIRIVSSIELLKSLAKDHPVCIVSGSSRKTVGEAVANMELESYLAFFLGADDYSPGKPDPRCYVMAADRLGLLPEECLVFEDSEVGLRAAKDAGMPCVILASPNRPPQDFSAADLVMTDLGEFKEEEFSRGLRG